MNDLDAFVMFDLPEAVGKRLYKSEAGLLLAAIEEMIYARGHDDKMHSTFPEKLYVKELEGSTFYAEKLGAEGNYWKTDVFTGKLRQYLLRAALKEAMK